MAQLKDSLVAGDLRVTGTIYGNVPLNDLVDADDLKAIEALTGTSGVLTKTAANTWTLNSSTTPASHSHGNITNAGQLGTASRIVVTDSSKNITTGSIDPANIVVKADLATLVAATDAMVFKGTLGTGGTITALPASHQRGDTYRIITAGTYAGVVCEAGDLIMCITTGTSADNAHWTVAQTNIDGAVTGPTSSTDGNIAVFNGTSGKVIKDGGILATNISLKGHKHEATDIENGYLNLHPENSPPVVPFLNNDIAFNDTRGGSSTIYSTTATTFTAAELAKTKTVATTASIFDGSGSYQSGFGFTTGNTVVLDITCHTKFSYTTKIYIDFGNTGWAPTGNVDLYLMNSDTETAYVSKGSFTNASTYGHAWFSVSHTSTSNGETVQGFNKIRFVLFNVKNTLRISQVGVINYGSQGTRQPYMSRGIDDEVWRSITPSVTGTYSLGTSSKKWANVYADTFTGSFNGTATNANYVNLYEARGTTTTLNKAAAYIGNGKMFHLVASSSTSSTDNGKPPMGDANIFQMNWDSAGGYDAQLAISTAANRMEFRDQPSTKKAWREVVTSTPGTAAGGTATPVYITDTGVATAITIADDTTSALNPIGVTSSATNTLKRDTSITMTGGTLSASRGIFTSTTDAEGTTNAGPALVVGGAQTSTHLELDANEIMAKGSGTTTAALYINNNGGLVTIGSGGLAITNTTDATSSTAAGAKTAGGLAVGKKIWLGSSLGAATNNNNGSQLIISSSDTGAGGNVALELWRGTNASWQFSNEGGNLHFRSNWTTAKQSTYSVDALTLNYNSGNASFLGNVTAPKFIGDIAANNIKPSITKTYTSTSYYGTDSWDNSNWYFMSAKPDAWNRPWRVRFKVRSYCPSYLNGDSVSWVELYGRNNSVTSYKIFNEFFEKGHYYIVAYPLKEAGFNAGYGVAIGVSIRYAWNYTNSAYYRTFVVDYYDCDNCTITMLDTPVKWASWTGTGSTNYGGLQTFDGYTRGLRETGDDNSYDLLQMSSNYLTNGSQFRFPPNTLFGFDRAGYPQAFSLYSSEYASSTTGVNTARVYNSTTGIDWTKGLWYKADGTNHAKSADLNISIRSAASAVDLRYSDNCVANANATTLGMVNRRPVFIRGIIKEDGLFYVRPLSVTYSSATYQRFWTQDIPTAVEKDGNYQYVYWLIGYPYWDSSYAGSLYRVDLQENNKMFWYYDGAFREYTAAEAYLASHPVYSLHYNSETQTLHFDFVPNEQITTLSNAITQLQGLHATSGSGYKTVAQEIASSGGTITETTPLNIGGVQFTIQNA